MSSKKNSLGFEERRTNWEPYKGRFVYAAHNSEAVLGVVLEIDVNRGYIDFMPSIVGNGDGSLSINDELPTRSFLPINLIRPLTQKPKDYVRTYNQRLKDKDKRNGKK